MREKFSWVIGWRKDLLTNLWYWVRLGTLISWLSLYVAYGCVEKKKGDWLKPLLKWMPQNERKRKVWRNQLSEPICLTRIPSEYRRWRSSSHLDPSFPSRRATCCLFGALPLNQGVSFDAPAFVAPRPFVALEMKTPSNPCFKSPTLLKKTKKQLDIKARNPNFQALHTNFWFADRSDALFWSDGKIC